MEEVSTAKQRKAESWIEARTLLTPPCELTVKSAEYVCLYYVLCLSIKAVMRQRVSRIIALREIT